MSSRIGKSEWKIAYAVAGIVDIIQWLADLTGVGVAVNEVADPIIGVLIAIYFQFLRGVSLITKPGRLASLFGATALENLTGSIAPAWIIDVWYIHRSVVNEEAENAANKQQQAMLSNQRTLPLNQDGTRAPRNGGNETNNVVPLNVDGIRMAA